MGKRLSKKIQIKDRIYVTEISQIKVTRILSTDYVNMYPVGFRTFSRILKLIGVGSRSGKQFFFSILSPVLWIQIH